MPSSTREVAVHLEHELGAVGQRAAESRQVRRSKPFLPLPVQHRDEVELRRQPVGKLSRSVRRVVVDHEHLDALVGQRMQHPLEVLALVVGR
jgi:hypothetical protein